MKSYDAVIIGFGKGGKTLAADLAGRGWSVAVVERSEGMYGGTCINIGCIPTKTLVHQAKLASAMSGAEWDERREFYRQAVAIKDMVTSSLRDKNFHSLADHPNITLYTGEGSFVSPDEVAVTSAAGGEILRSEHIFINTGASTVIPPIDGIDSREVRTSTSIMEDTELPRRLVIIGGGYVGLEFASIYSSFGSEVTVLESAPRFLPREDRDVAACVREVMERKGVAVRLNAQISSIRDGAAGAVVAFRDGADVSDYEVGADIVLVAVGRRPYTDGLNLAAAGVETDGRGAIVVDEHLRTTNPAIRAMGDVRGGAQFTYVSLDDYRIVRDELFGSGVRTTADREPIPYSVFIDPPLSRIGMGEEEARAKGYDIRVNRITVADINRTRTTGETDGMLKAVIDAKTDRILGCTLFCHDSHEVINTVALAMKTGLTASALAGFIYTHPTMTESLNALFA